MAKKKITPNENPAPSAAPAKRRRTPAKKNAGNGYQPSRAEIAEAAYFRHLKRGGSPSDEFKDWVEAERELMERRRSGASQSNPKTQIPNLKS